MKKPRGQTSPYEHDSSAGSPAPSPTPSPLSLAPQRQGDRGDVDDAAVALPVFIKFRDLVAAGIVSNWPTLARLIDEEGFPAGILLGKNTRAFRLDEVQAWLDTRPTERKVVSRRVSEQQPEA